MSDGVVLDTNVALKIVRPEEHYSDLAVALITDCIRSDRTLFISPLLLIEATSALHQAVRSRSRRLPLADAVTAIAELAQFPFVPVEPPGIYQRTLEFAAEHQLPSAYDALSVVTAQRLGVELWTADQNLLNALGRRAPWVRSLREYATQGDGSTAL
jgi:predicted nucleic acid-binding protein